MASETARVSVGALCLPSARPVAPHVVLHQAYVRGSSAMRLVAVCNHHSLLAGSSGPTWPEHPIPTLFVFILTNAVYPQAWPRSLQCAPDVVVCAQLCSHLQGAAHARSTRAQALAPQYTKRTCVQARCCAEECYDHATNARCSLVPPGPAQAHLRCTFARDMHQVNQALVPGSSSSSKGSGWS